MENATFGMSTSWVAWREGRPDVMLVETWPLLAAQLNIWLARCWKVPVVYYIQDVYPEVLEYAGLIKPSGLLASALRAWDRSMCMRSDRVVVISEGMKRLLCDSRRVPENKVAVVQNWLDESLFPSLPRNNGWRNEIGIPVSKFVLLFAGTFGHVSGAEVLVDVAQRLQEYEDIVILCVGEGVVKQEMVSAAQQQHLTNIEFRSSQPVEKVCQMHASVDVTILTLQPDYPDASVPSKLITYLAAGRPVICAAPLSSSAAVIVLEAKAGLVATPGSADAIAEAVLGIRQSPAQAAEMGRNARVYFLQHYTLVRAYRQFSKLFSELAAAPA